jgi:predicted RecB family nuclease
MVLNNEVIDSFLFCKYKAYLKMTGNYGDKTDYELAESELYKQYKEQFLTNIRSSYKSEQIIYPTSPLEVNFVRSESILINPEVKGDGFLISFDVIQISHPINTRKKASYIPIMITPKEKLTKNEKISLTVKTLLLNRIIPQFPETGRIILGKKLKISSIRMKDYRRTAQKVLYDLTILMTENAKPLIMRRDNCRICEFEENCRRYLIERDDLSLMRRLSATEIIKKNKKGIFTINQLSYNFRPKRFKKMRAGGSPFSPELKALAIKDKKTYILDTPHDIKSGRIEIYLDFEGLPDENFIYLIGLIIKGNDSEKKVSLWADSEENEREIFQNFVTTISGYKDSVIYHYGSYETRELKRAMKLYPEIHLALAEILDRTVNLLSLFYSSIYPPTYTNELKEIGRFLGFDWTDKHSSGIQSIAWRKRWELSRDARYKDMLLRYNNEDCQALMVIKIWIYKLIHGKCVDETKDLGYVKDIMVDGTYKFGKIDYLIRDLEQINNCAYFNYQREKILIKTNAKLKKIINKQKRLNNSPKILHPNTHVKISPPKKCPYCGDKRKFYRHKKDKRLIQDLKFIKNGVKRWVIEYERGEFRCSKCFKIIIRGKFIQPIRRNLYFWVINQYIAYSTSFNKIKLILSELFNLGISRQALHKYKSIFAIQYEETYKEILLNIIRGPLLHIDETKIKVGGSSGYVWILSNIDSVYYLYKTSREGDFLKDLLKDFKGVLISDFYSAYDSMECPQQKCLIHLIRDLNDDLAKNQFDLEFKEIVIQFGILLRRIMETIHRYGLKKRHLNKHKTDVKKFFNYLVNYEYRSDLALQYQKRFKKNQDKLFTFLNYDEIPWNNNNAEHAIKHLAGYRRNVDGLFSENGIKEYLVLLSIYQTCQYRGLNFLQFLRSEEKNLLGYFKKHYRFR